MTDLRKVQRTPQGTFFVCLPRAWADMYDLKKGAVVSVVDAGDGKLLIDAKYNIESPPREVSLQPGPFLGREIVSKYLLGFDVIRIEAKERISFEVRDTVKKTVGRLIGLEIIEEDYGSIVLQCLLEPASLPPEKNMRRSYMIAAGMHRDVVNAFVGGDVQLAKSVVARDDEGNRLYFLLVRILRTVIQNPNLSERLGVSPIECLDYRLAASLVEAIGDECARVAMKTIELKGKKPDRELSKLFLSFHATCFEAHENALRAFLEGDMKLAENVRSMRGKMDAAFADIEEATREQPLEVVPQILSVASFLRQIYEHSVDIADLVMPKKT